MSRLVLLCGEALLLAGDDDVPPERVAVSDPAAQAVARLNAASITVVLASEPPPFAGGRLPAAAFAQLHERIRDGLARRGARLEAILPPGEGLAASLAAALERYRGIPAGTPVLCESVAALEAALALGCPRLLLRTRAGRAVQAAGIADRLLPVGVQADLAAAVEPVLRIMR